MSDKIKIFYVDDEPDIRLIAELALKLKPNIEVRTAESGEDALDQLRSDDWRPDLAMIDMMMPGLSGVEVMGELRADPDLTDIPVVFVTARARPQDIRDYIEEGAVGVVTKPFDPTTLADQVLKLIG